MSKLGTILSKLGEEIIPKVALKVFPDTCFISRATETKDSKGVLSQAWANTTTDAIPCTYEPKTRNRKDDATGQWMSVMEYYITLPTNHQGDVLDLLPTDRIVVEARGNQPEKTFKVRAIKNDSGVVLEAICEIEN